MTKLIIVAMIASTLSVSVAIQTLEDVPVEPTVTWQELKAYEASPVASPTTVKEVQLLVETWDSLLALNNPDGVIAVSTLRFQEQTFGTTDNLRAAFATPAPPFNPNRSGEITVRDVRQVDGTSISAIVHISGYEDSDSVPGRVYFGIFKREDSIWKIDYLRPDLFVVDETAPDVVTVVITAANFERNGATEVATP